MIIKKIGKQFDAKKNYIIYKYMLSILRKVLSTWSRAVIHMLVFSLLYVYYTMIPLMFKIKLHVFLQ